MKTGDLKNTKEIIFLKGVANYTEFHFKDGKKTVSCFTLKRYEESLPSFVRINRSYLINPRFVKHISLSGTENLVHLETGKVMSVSRRRKGVVKALLEPLPENRKAANPGQIIG